jgi:nucleoside-diphosphate-sugar epimerase
MRRIVVTGAGGLLGQYVVRAVTRPGVEIVGLDLRSAPGCAALRLVFLLFPSMLGEVRARHLDPSGYRGPSAGGHVAAGGGMCLHHVDPRDVAEAFRLAIDSPCADFQSYWLAAASTLHPLRTLERIAQVFGRLPAEIDQRYYDAAPYAPMFDRSRAEKQLGWRAVHDYRPIIFATERTHS